MLLEHMIACWHTESVSYMLLDWCIPTSLVATEDFIIFDTSKGWESQGRNWGAQGTQISGTPGGHRGNAPGDKPWEVALGGGGPPGSGKDGKGNPEITPLEVCTCHLSARQPPRNLPGLLHRVHAFLDSPNSGRKLSNLHFTAGHTLPAQHACILQQSWSNLQHAQSLIL